MDGSHFSDEMSDEVTIEQQRKEELAAMVPPLRVPLHLGALVEPSNGSKKPVVKEPKKQKRSGPTRT